MEMNGQDRSGVRFLRSGGILCLLAGLVVLTVGMGRPQRAVVAAGPKVGAVDAGRWIWAYGREAAPKNRFTYFRKVFGLSELPADTRLYFAADSNAHLWINGHILRRKVARYHEGKITAELVNAGPYLRIGENVIVVLHHNWGDIVTFQRTGNKHGGLYVSSTFVASDGSWRCIRAPQYFEHDKQIVGIAGNAPRIRYPQIVDVQKRLTGDIFSPGFDDSRWAGAIVVDDGPWPEVPAVVETPGQREYAVRPLSVLNAGKLHRDEPLSDDPLSIAQGIRNARYQPDAEAVRQAGKLIQGGSTVIEAQTGESYYITYDFSRPVHGYPYIKSDQAPAGTVVDFGYCELSRSQYAGRMHVKANGWIDPEGVVGPGYADRCILTAGQQQIELPDERTARWLSLHIHFTRPGRLVLEDVGIVKSQYPVKMYGSFQCGDERLEQIVKLCRIHAEVTMSDAYVDTPGREDGQWIEDDRPRAKIAARWFGDTRLREFLIRTHAQGQGEDGNFHPFSPSNYPAYPAPYDWSVQWVAALYDDYMWSGETERIRQYWPNLCRYWEKVLSLVDERGLWRTEHVLADIRVGVHPMKNQSSGIVTPWIIERLGWSAKMARAVGQIEQAHRWQQMAGKMRAAFRRYHIVAGNAEVPVHVADVFDPNRPEAERGYSQAGQTIAVTTGLLTKKEALADLNYAVPKPDGSPPAQVTRWNNPTYFYRVLKALSHVGLHKRAVSHLIERYSAYLPANPANRVPLGFQGPYGGPAPEYWVSREDLGLQAGQLNKAQPVDETGSHGWQSVPLLWLHDTLLGVKIVEPGGGKIRIAPEDGGLPYVSGHTLTPKGGVWVYWDTQKWRLEVEIPDGVTAEVIMPAACAGKRVEVLRSAGAVERSGANRFTLHAAGEYAFQVQ